MSKIINLIIILFLTSCLNSNNPSDSYKDQYKSDEKLKSELVNKDSNEEIKKYSNEEKPQSDINSNSEHLEFLNEFFYSIAKSESIYTTLRNIKNNPDLSKAIIDEDEDLIVELLDHPYLDLRNSNAELKGFSKFYKIERDGYAGFSITLYNQRNLNNARIFEEIMSSIPVKRQIQLGEQSKKIFFRCNFGCKTSVPQIISQIEIYSNKDSYFIDKDVDDQVFTIVLNFDFDHDGLYN